MKKKFIKPTLINLGVKETKSIQPRSVDATYPNPVKCLVCGLTFDNGSKYNEHLRLETVGVDVNNPYNNLECGSADHSDGKVEEIAQFLS